MARQKPIYGVFIIESMGFDNETENKLDGYILKTILDLCDIPSIYYYIRTKLEFENVIEKFKESGFGFLHISCHGNENGLVLTLEDIDLDELEMIIGNNLKYRRLFLSTCQVATFELAKHFIPKYHCYSVIGTPENIDLDRAAVFWSSFYYLMYFDDKEQMFQKNLLPILEKTSDTFKLKLNYFSIINDRQSRSINHLREITYDKGKKIVDVVKKTEFENLFWEERFS